MSEQSRERLKEQYEIERGWLVYSQGIEYANLPAHEHEDGKAYSQTGYRSNCSRCRWLIRARSTHKPGNETEK